MQIVEAPAGHFEEPNDDHHPSCPRHDIENPDKKPCRCEELIAADRDEHFSNMAHAERDGA